MTIEKMELIHFRNYEKLELQPHPEINLFFGENGSGKTNLLEAIHFCSLGKSHRLSQDANAVLIGEKAAAVRVEVRSRLSRSRIEIRLSPGEENIKSVWIDGNRASRLSEMMGLLRCVIFSPEDLNLIREGPAVRRRFLDMMISQISRPYFIALQQYRTAMNHRSAILRTARLENRPVSGMIEDFEQAMSDYAETIYRERFGHERFLSEMANEMYREISGREQETFQIQYRSCMKSDRDGSPSLKEALRDCREEDMKNGTTSVGPHRDDLSLTLNSRNMKNYASQGQMRTGALSLKLAQLKVIQKVTGENPVLLLDDVMSELDPERRSNLLHILQDTQTFITCTDRSDLSDYIHYRTYQVREEGGRGDVSEILSGPEPVSPVFTEPVFE
jgi:DNA replication and repair protein RecF